MSDHSEIEEITLRLKQSSKRLNDLAQQLGRARTIREYDTDRRRSALAIEVVKALKDGQSATAAEHIGRASPEYQSKLNELEEQYESAEKVIAEYHATQASWESARSLLALSRESLRNMPE